MPRLNGTGPFGLGSRTGRGSGPCESSDAESSGVRDRWRRVMGRNRSSSSEVSVLKREREILQDKLKDIERRIAETER